MLLSAGVNAGLSIQTKDCRIWLDVLHTTPVQGFSSVTPQRWAEIRCHSSFASPNLILYTHTHPDHYSPVLTQEALSLWPQAELLLPSERTHTEPIKRGQTTLCFFPLPHEKPYDDVSNNGVFIDDGDTRILIVGDCALASPVLSQLKRTIPQPDAVVLPFLWLTSRMGRCFLEAELSRTMLVFNHLPFSEDDVFHYHKAANKYFPLFPKSTMFTELFQTIYINKW